MSSAMPTPASSEQGLPSSTALASEWYPSTTPYHYMTPYSTAPLDTHKWAPPVSTPYLDLSYSTLPIQQHYATPARPRSSPSTFGPAPESIDWQGNALGIQYENEMIMPPPNAYDHVQLSAPNTPELRQPVPRKPYASIAPNPAMVALGKRRHDSEGDIDPTKRRKRTASVNSADLSEDDRYLVKLKEDESLPWKEIATRFHTDKGKSFQVAALQMRYKRLREKFRIWEDQDVNALKLAHEYWQKYKWEIISQKMTEFGSPERWPARNCARKWQEMELMAVSTIPAPASIGPPMSHYSTSPIEAPVQYAFMPM